MEEVYPSFQGGVAFWAAMWDVFWPWEVKHILFASFLEFRGCWGLAHGEIIVFREGKQSTNRIES